GTSNGLSDAVGFAERPYVRPEPTGWGPRPAIRRPSRPTGQPAGRCPPPAPACRPQIRPARPLAGIPARTGRSRPPHRPTEPPLTFEFKSGSPAAAALAP